MAKANPKISVVMPVYNVKRYLRECLNSVLGQTLKDIEIILVDDGSTDGSLEIEKEYAKKDSRVKVVEKKHSNAGESRNVGMKLAAGEYLSFLDSDDVFSPYLFETLLDGAKRWNADVASCGYVPFFDGRPVPEFVRPRNVVWADVSMGDDQIVGPSDPFCPGTGPCNKIYKADHIKKFRLSFLEQSSTNDFTFVAAALSLAEKSICAKEPLILYRQHVGSTQAKKSKSPLNFLSAIKAYAETMQLYDVWNDTHCVKREFSRFYVSVIPFELQTLVSKNSYLLLYNGIKNLEEDIHVLNAFAPRYDYEKRDFVRYRKIVCGSPIEKVRMWIESNLAPILGRRRRTHGLDRCVSEFFRLFIYLLFEFPWCVRIVWKTVKRWIAYACMRGSSSRKQRRFE